MSLPDPAAIAAKSHLLPMLRAAMRAINAGQFDQAEPLLDNLLAQEPDFADALHMKGYIALQRGDLDLARTLVEQAIKIDFHFENYHLTHGHILLAAGERDAAKRSFGTAITLNQSMPDPYIGLGHIFLGEGDIDSAIGAMITAFQADRKNAETNYMLGYALMAKGDAKKAMVYLGRAHEFAPGNPRYKIAFARALRDLRMKRPDAKLLTAVLSLLGTPGIEPRDLAPVIESAIRSHPIFAYFDVIDDLPPKSIAAFLGQADCPDPLQAPGLAEWLEHGLVCDPLIERRLIALRRGLLVMALKLPDVLPRYRRLLNLMAIRAFQSEYLDAFDPTELPILDILGSQLDQADPAVAAPLFAVYALYRPLYQRHDAERLAQASWPPEFSDLKRRQLDEPLTERRIAPTLPTLMPIEDRTSVAVREMYEESPFPRWHQPVFGTPLSVPVRVRSALPFQTITAGNTAAPNILVAGCGTGLHAILAATSYSNARVLAIDLSRTSLSYAKRKADELGITNVDFAQADILKLGGIGRQFDVIESFGVLHHLREPAAGLAQLVSLLKPEGFMMLGLYSELGRRDVVIARDLIAKHGYGDSPDEVRRFRADLPRLHPKLSRRLGVSSAYYALSDLRDLVFHRQEHRYTPKQLQQLIDGAGLEFLGFEFTSPQALMGYRSRFPDDPRAVNLDHWTAVEIENPDLFANCYRFWVRRKT